MGKLSALFAAAAFAVGSATDTTPPVLASYTLPDFLTTGDVGSAITLRAPVEAESLPVTYTAAAAVNGLALTAAGALSGTVSDLTASSTGSWTSTPSDSASTPNAGTAFTITANFVQYPMYYADGTTKVKVATGGAIPVFAANQDAVVMGRLTGATTGGLCTGAGATFTTIRKDTASGVDVTAAVKGASSAAVGSDGSAKCTFGFGDLADGTYCFKGASACIATLTIDRRAPVATDKVYATNVVIGSTASVPITGMFDETVIISSITSVSNNAGFVAGSTTLTAATVGGSKGKSVYKVTAADAAGNTASAMLTVTLIDRPTPVIEFKDARGSASAVRSDAASTAFYTGSAASRVGGVANGALEITVTVSYSQKMVAGVAAGAAFSCTTGSGCVSALVGTIPTDGATSITYKITSIAAASPLAITLVAGAHQLASDTTVTSAVSSAITVTYALAATGITAAPITATYKAAVDLDFFTYIPDTLFTAGKGAMEIVSATTNQAGAGLTVFPGKINRAYVVGKVAAANRPVVSATGSCTASAGAKIVFTLSGRDAAGYTATADLCIDVVDTPTNGPTVLYAGSSAATPLQYTEGAAAASVFTATTVTIAGDLTISATLLGYLETPQSVNGEALSSAVGTAGVTYGVSSVNGINLASFTRTAVGTATAGKTTQAELKAALESVQYANTDIDAVNTDAINTRTVRAIAVVPTTNVVLGYVSRDVKFIVVNDVPVVDFTAGPVPWVETISGADFKLLFAGTTIVDLDDDNMRKAVITIASTLTAAQTDAGYLPCDTARDSLIVTSTAVAWVYTAKTCTLTISPLSGTTISKATLIAALGTVAFKTLDKTNPNGFAYRAGVKSRLISLTVTDDAAAGKVSGAKSSVAKTLELTVESIKTAPTWNYDAAFGANGLFVSADAFANTKTVTLGGKTYTYRKPTIVVPAFVGSATTAVPLTPYLAWDLKNKVTGKDGVYAMGAIQYSDVQTTSAIPTITFTPIAGGAPAPATALATSDFTAGAYGSPVLNGFASPASIVAANRGEYKVTITFDTAVGMVPSAGLDVYFDIRQMGCNLLTTFDAIKSYPSSQACATGLADSDVQTNINPNSATKTIPVVLTVGTGVPTATIDALVSFTDAQKTTALFSARNAARGSYSLSVTPAFVSAPSSIKLTARPAKDTEVAALPAPASGTIDLGLALKMLPAGTTFSDAVDVCIYIGNIASNVMPSLVVSSQIDSFDADKGYGKWESLPGQTYDAKTGKLCAKTTHFSVFAPQLVAVPVTPTVNKMMAMGASCPNDCSGRGYCREQGKCLCFEGFTGYDCSQRTCASAESWDVPADLTFAHKPAECSARGACDRKSGQCVCYPGFEGAACDRVSCPNSCNNHGRCRLLSELPNTSSLSSWESKRIQVCECDAGYTGEDCSQRVCPYGDDPETVCNDDVRQIQRITLDFGSLPPSGVDFTATNSMSSNDEISLTFTTTGSSKSFSTPAIANVWQNPTAAKDNLAAALKALPEFAVSEVTVSSNADGNNKFVQYDVTFTGNALTFTSLNGYTFPDVAAIAVAGNTVPGNQAALQCSASTVGSFVTGCKEDGCRPKHKQPRLLSVTGTGTDYVTFNADSILEQPVSSVDKTANFDTANVWGVEVLVTIKSDGTSATYQTDTTVYGVSESTMAGAAKPIPTAADLKSNVALGNGLFVDFPSVAPAGTYTATFKWRLPTCKVTTEVKASDNYEVSECSSRGICDRKSGQCGCFSGYAGYNCGQQTVIV